MERRNIILGGILTATSLMLVGCAPENKTDEGIDRTVPNDKINKREQIKPESGKLDMINDVAYEMHDEFISIGGKDAENRVRIYADMSCPHCKVLKLGNKEIIKKTIEENKNVRFEFVTVNFMGAPFEYSWSPVTANALAAIADMSPENYLDAETILYENQPSQRTKDATNPEYLLSLFSGLNLKEDVKNAIRDMRYLDWINNDVTPWAKSNGVNGTPFVTINNERLSNAGELRDRLRKLS